MSDIDIGVGEHNGVSPCLHTKQFQRTAMLVSCCSMGLGSVLIVNTGKGGRRVLFLPSRTEGSWTALELTLLLGVPEQKQKYKYRYLHSTQ